MKKQLITTTLLLTLAATVPTVTMAQQQTQNQELVDSMEQTDELEAYSDTTDTTSYDITVVSPGHRMGGFTNSNMLNDIFDGVGEQNFIWMIFAMIFLVLILVVAPIVIFVILLYFIFRNRKQKMKLAEMAMQNGQPIPDQLLEDQKEDNNVLWQKGMRQTFLGIGLMFFLGYTAGEVGFGIGALITAIGVGKLIIVKTEKRL